MSSVIDSPHEMRHGKQYRDLSDTNLQIKEIVKSPHTSDVKDKNMGMKNEDLSSVSVHSNKNISEPPDKKSSEMPWSEVFLRGIYGAAACGLYLVAQRKIFGQALPVTDLVKVTASGGVRAIAMSTVTKAIRETYKKLDSTKNRTLKDAGEVGIITAVETAASYVQDKTTAKNVSPLNVLGLSFIKSIPNNAMDTKTYQDWTKSGSPAGEKRTNLIMNTLNAFATAVPATFLNNEPLTAVNFVKTFGLRWLSVNLWREAMGLAKQHGDYINSKFNSNPEPKIEKKENQPIE